MFVKKLIITLSVVMTCLLLLCSCNYNSNDISGENNNTNSLNDNATEDHSQMLHYSTVPYAIRMGMSYCVYFDSFDENKSFDAIRQVGDKVYTVSKQSDGSYMFMLFEEIITTENESKLMLTDGFKVHTLTDKNTFKDITTGISKEDVLSMDPSAYVFGDSYSFHRFSDKSVIQIHYKADIDGVSVVSEITELDTEHSVITYLLPEDLSLITD